MADTVGVKEAYTSVRTPFHDVIGIFGHCQNNHKCRELELNLLDCTDVYGRKSLKVQCIDEYEDYLECLNSKKQYKRVQEMQKERMRQYFAGKRDKSKLHSDAPPLDSYYKTYIGQIG